MGGIPFPVIMGVAALVITAAFAGLMVERRRFAAEFAGDAEYRCRFSWLGKPVVETRRGPLPATLTVAATSEADDKRFHIQVAGISLGRRTTLSIGVEGFVDVFREQLGFAVVTSGDVAFDNRFVGRGSDVVAASVALADGAVQRAIARLFAADDVRRCELDRRGILNVDVACRALTAPEARAALAKARELAVALDDWARSAGASPRLASSSSSSSSVPAARRPVGARERSPS